MPFSIAMVKQVSAQAKATEAALPEVYASIAFAQP